MSSPQTTRRPAVPADLSKAMADAAATPRTPLDVGRLHQRGLRRRRRQHVLAAAASVIVLAFAAGAVVQLGSQADVVLHGVADNGGADSASPTPHDAPPGSDPPSAAEAERQDAALATEQAATPPNDVVGEAVWWPAEPDAVTPDTQVLDVLVLELECASGKTAEGRVEPPTIEWSNETVTVTYRIRPMELKEGEGITCQGHPPTPQRLDLGGPLGDRRLLDGSPEPPRQPVPCRATVQECRDGPG